MRRVFEPNDRVRVSNKNLDCDGETGRIIEREPLGSEMFVYKVKLDTGETVKIDTPSISVNHHGV